jgi:hypothetical protein
MPSKRPKRPSAKATREVTQRIVDMIVRLGVGDFFVHWQIICKADAKEVKLEIDTAKQTGIWSPTAKEFKDVMAEIDEFCVVLGEASSLADSVELVSEAAMALEDEDDDDGDDDPEFEDDDEDGDEDDEPE